VRRMLCPSFSFYLYISIYPSLFFSHSLSHTHTLSLSLVLARPGTYVIGEGQQRMYVIGEGQQRIHGISKRVRVCGGQNLYKKRE
jgi:hypothetical protein